MKMRNIEIAVGAFMLTGVLALVLDRKSVV